MIRFVGDVAIEVGKNVEGLLSEFSIAPGLSSALTAELKKQAELKKPKIVDLGPGYGPIVKQIGQANIAQLKLTEAARQFNKELTKSIQNFGRLADYDKLDELVEKGLGGADADDLDQLIRVKDAMTQIGALRDSLKSPFDTWAQGLNQLELLLNKGLISLGEFGRLSGKLLQDFAQATNVIEQMSEIKSPEAIVAGSRQAITLELERSNQMGRQPVNNNPAELLRRAMEKTQQIEKDQLENGKQMLDVLRKIKPLKAI